jgi:hypothetical protein
MRNKSMDIFHEWMIILTRYEGAQENMWIVLWTCQLELHKHYAPRYI